MNNQWGSTFHFTKMHGLGNDYIYVNCLEKELINPAEVSQQVADRHFGIGGDGLVLILPSTVADFRMRMFNADGSEAQNCGNAVRCIAKYVFDKRITNKETITLETLAGILQLTLTIEDSLVSSVCVNMGSPILDPIAIPLNMDYCSSNAVEFEIAGQQFSAYCVSMGNPHAVIFVEDITDSLVLEMGPLIEHHPLFPQRVNVEFVRVSSPSELEMRVWERGSGETLACGTGASAVCVAGVQTKRSNRAVQINLLGGSLNLHWEEDSNNVLMTGPATTVFDGIVNLKTF